MSEPKFTPGPWSVYTQSFPHEVLICTQKPAANYDSPVDEQIAWTSKNPFACASPSYNAKRKQDIANAHLIASSPALFNFVDIVASMDSDGGLDPANMLRALIRDARGLRAQALGESR